jgi:acetyltransferase
VVKFLVRRPARGRGHGRALLSELESHAGATGRWLLTLDTETGTPAEAMYERWGWQRYGVVEDYAARPDSVLAPTTFFVKRLRPPG